MNVNKALEILGLHNDSNIDQIKNKYKKLALEFHPDKNKEPGSKDKFIKISEAYHFLKEFHDPNNYSKNSDNGLGPEIFMNMFYNVFNTQKMNFEHLRPKPFVDSVVLNIRQLYNGCKVNITIDTKIKTGNTIKQLGSIKVQESVYKIVKETYVVDVPKCHNIKEPVIFKDMIFSEELYHDLQLYINIQEDPIYTLDNQDLHINLDLTIGEILLGFRKEIEGLDPEEPIIIESHRIFDYKEPKRQIGCGFTKEGDLIIHINIKIPEIINESDSQFIKNTTCLWNI